MGKNSHLVKAIIEIDELKPGMKIIEYLGLDVSYGSIDNKTGQFFRNNFKGCQASILRHQRKIEININRLQTGDVILKIYHFPASIKKLTQVSDNLIGVLQDRRFFKFKVQYAISLPSGFKESFQNVMQMLNAEVSLNRNNQQKSVGVNNKPITKVQRQYLLKKKRQTTLENRAYKLVETVNKSDEIRNEASSAIEFYMDNARKGKIDGDEIKSYINDIALKASPEAISAITNLKKSDQTYGHCIDVASLFHSVYFKLLKKNKNRSAFKKRNEALLGGFLHDFGKAKIPKYIIDSSSQFSRDSDEMTIMKAHPKFGAKLLIDEMSMPAPIINMALFHHVKHDTNMSTSYPREFDYNKAIYETKLLSIIDAYQALVGKRKYKRSWSPAAAMRYLDALAGIEFDFDIWEDVKQVMGIYPKGTVVQLNDNSLGFVMSVPKNDLVNPTVAVFRNAYNQDLDNHPLIDLQMNPEISIQNDLDQYEVFGSGSRALEKFKSINIASS
ncbi:MAG: HD domain-containing protein [Deltaproteobacteria bacterium]|jgi:HD-GYP domain-containing protein (c-di-GMP phosphodiesterase class II)|nr:HD domain-containing protein [Deltaproteobacteria bacterium]MBT4526530.1 HD domain-containing protein [Deltaproteobacteria bacterium]